jgi:hypothetical protein
MASATLPAWRSGADGDRRQHIAKDGFRSICGQHIRTPVFDRPDWERCTDCQTLHPFVRRVADRMAEWRASRQLMEAAMDRFGLDDPRVHEYVRNHNRFQSEYEQALADLARVQFGGVPSPT